MKINKIYIHAFGGLKDFTLELNDGLNVIYGNNEDGKSTVAAFIKAMFYGTGRSNKNLSESTRQKYTPWDNSTMAGRIYFEHGGKNYCLEREFRKSDSTDRIEITDLDSGKPINISDNIGQQFFGLSVSAFERSLFIGNGDFIKDDAAAGEINGKLSNIAVTGNEDVSYKEIENNIFKARTKLISKNNQRGSYNDDLKNLNLLEQRFEAADRDAKLKQQLHDEGSAKLREIEGLVKIQDELNSKLDLKQDFENRERLTDFLKTKDELDSLNATLTLTDGTAINEAFVQKIDFCISKHLKCGERCKQIEESIKELNEIIEVQNKTSPQDAKARIDTLSAEVEVLSAQKTMFSEQQAFNQNNINVLKSKLDEIQNKKASINPAILTMSIICACVGAALSFVYLPATVVLCVIAAILLSLSFIINPQNKNAVINAQNDLSKANNELSETIANKNRTQEQINNIDAEINRLSSALNADAAVKAQYLANLKDKQNTLDTEKEKLADATDELLNLVSGFKGVSNVEDIKLLCDDLKKKTEQQKVLKLQLKTASQYLGNIDYADARVKLEKINNTTDFENIDFSETELKYKTLSDKILSLKENLTAIVTELKTSFRNSENPEELRRKIEELQVKAKAKKDFCDSADVAIEVLQESFYELRRGYGNELEKATHEIFAKLTDGKYKQVNVSSTLDLSVESNEIFGTRELGYLSLGTTQQAYLSLRLAIAKLISEDSALPIFLDDSLSQYDDTRTEKAMKFLIDYCKNGQGVLFTCHNSICDIAQKEGLSVLKPYVTK